MKNWIKTYEAIQSKIDDESVQMHTITYWNSVKHTIWHWRPYTEYETFCNEVIEFIMRDEMWDRIDESVLFDLVKVGLPDYAVEC